MDEVETYVVNSEDGILQIVNSQDENNNEQPSYAKWSPEKFTQHIMDIVFGKSDGQNTGLREVGFLKSQTTPCSWSQWMRVKKPLLSVIGIETERQKIVEEAYVEEPLEYRKQFLRALRIHMNDRFPLALGYGMVFDKNRHSTGYEMDAKKASNFHRSRDAVYTSLKWAFERKNVLNPKRERITALQPDRRQLQRVETVLPGNVSLDGFGLMVVNEDEVTEEAKEALRILADLFENNPSTKASETVLRKVDAANVAAMMIIRQKSLSEIFKSLPYLRVTTNDQFLLYERYTSFVFRKTEMYKTFTNKFSKLQKILKFISEETKDKKFLDTVKQEINEMRHPFLFTIRILSGLLSEKCKCILIKDETGLSNDELCACAREAGCPVVWILLRFDNAVVFEGSTVFSGLTEGQATFIFVTCFSTFLIDWTDCKSIGVSRTLELIHRYALEARCNLKQKVPPTVQKLLMEIYMVQNYDEFN